MDITIPFSTETLGKDILGDFNIDGKGMFFAPIQKALGDNSTGTVVRGMASTSDEDRTGDIVLPDAFRSSIEFFMSNNPLMFLNHNWDAPIGRVTSAEITSSGLAIVGKLDDAADNPEAKRAAGYVDRNLLNAFSIGFRILDFDFRMDPHDEFSIVGMIIKDLELLEVSLVTIPANRNATTNSFKMFGQVGSDLQARKMAEHKKNLEHNETKNLVVEIEEIQNITTETKEIEENSPRGVAEIKSDLYGILCDDDFGTLEEDEELSRAVKYSELALELDSSGLHCPHYRKHTKMEIKEILDGKRYEFQLFFADDEEVMVWENTSNEIHKLNEMPRMIKNHIKSTDTYNKLSEINTLVKWFNNCNALDNTEIEVHNVDNSLEDETTENVVKSPETEKVEVPSKNTGGESAKLELAVAIKGVLDKLDSIEKAQKGRDTQVNVLIERAISQAKLSGDL